MSESGEVLATWSKTADKGPMQVAAALDLEPGAGIVDVPPEKQHRQVTLIDEAAWGRATTELGVAVDPMARRANVLLRGIELAETTGRRIRIGTTLLVVRGETVPCAQMDDAHQGLRKALEPEWRGGAHAEVLEAGRIAPGDQARFEDA